MEIGTTRSGTVIEYRPQENIDEFRIFVEALSIQDRFDLNAMLQVLIVKAKRRHGEESIDFLWWKIRLEEVMKQLTQEEIDKQNLPLGLKTSYDLVRFGMNLLQDFWRQLE